MWHHASSSEHRQGRSDGGSWSDESVEAASILLRTSSVLASIFHDLREVFRNGATRRVGGDAPAPMTTARDEGVVRCAMMVLGDDASMRCCERCLTVEVVTPARAMMTMMRRAARCSDNVFHRRKNFEKNKKILAVMIGTDSFFVPIASFLRPGEP